MRVFFPSCWRRNLTCFSFRAVVGGGHPRAGDWCGRAVGHAEWRREGSQGQGRYLRFNTDYGISHNVNRSSFLLIPLQDLLVDCFKPTEVSCSFHSSSSAFHFACLWSSLFLSHCRTLSQSCWTRFEGCRSSPPLRRNDGADIPLFLPLLWSSIHLSSSYHT